MQAKKEEITQKCELIKMEKIRLQSELDILTAKIDKEETKLEKIEQLILALEEKLQNLDSQVNEKECEIEEEKQKLQEATQENEALEGELENTRKKVEELEEEIENMMDELANVQDYTTTAGSWPKERTIQHSRENERRNLQAQIEHKKARLSELKITLKEQKAELKDAINRRNAAERDIRIKSRQLENLVSAKEMTNNKLNNESRNKENCLNKLQEFERNYETQRSKYREQNELEIIKNMNLEELQTQNQLFKEQLHSEQAKHSEFKQKLKENESNLDRITKQREGLIKAKADLAAKKEQTHHELNQMIGEKKILEGQANRAREEIDRVNGQLNYVKLEKRNIERHIQSLNPQKFQKGLDVANRMKVGLEKGMNMKKMNGNLNTH